MLGHGRMPTAGRTSTMQMRTGYLPICCLSHFALFADELQTVYLPLVLRIR